MNEVAWYWKSILSTLEQRGLLDRRQDGNLIVPEADAILLQDRCVFILDMQRLGGISREEWLNPHLIAQVRAALQGRRVVVSDRFGIAIQVAREPGETTRRRLPAVIPLTPELIPEPPYHVCLGFTRRGPVHLDMAGAHRAILVGGTTGSGKTNLMQSVLLQLAAKHSPDEVRFAVADPKEVDFGRFEGLPHLFAPIAHEMEECTRLIEQVEAERIRRQSLMAARGASDWRHLEERLPLLLLVVDEAADFAGSSAMQTLVDIARKGRAFGISIVVGTQHPEAKVIDAQVRANLPTAIAFQTRTSVESRVILGCGGAERLNRPGLALTFVNGRWETVQTPLVTPEVTEKILGRASVPSRPALSDLESELVRYALGELRGGFVINALAERFAGRISRRQLLKLAQQWERRGWLTKPDNPTEPRRVTPELAALVGPAPAGKSSTTIPL